MAYLKPCRETGCHTLVSLNAVRCSLHAAAHAAARPGRHQTTRYGYGRSNWRRVRRIVLERARFTCELKLDDHCTKRATHVHLAEHLNGNHDAATPEDGKACCAHCSGVIDGARTSHSW